MTSSVVLESSLPLCLFTIDTTGGPTGSLSRHEWQLPVVWRGGGQVTVGVFPPPAPTPRHASLSLPAPPVAALTAGCLEAGGGVWLQ